MSLKRPFRLSPLNRGLAGALAVGITLVACGGGGGGGSDNTGPGTTSASYSEGRVSGFGSVIVNGVAYDETNAEVVNEDGETIAGGVQLGMVVEVEGSDITPAPSPDELPTSVASVIRIRSVVRGPVEFIDIPGNTLTVLGQTVNISDSTVLEEQLSTLAQGEVVDVHGYATADGRIFATRIETRDPGTEPTSSYKLVGSIATVNTAARTFTIGGTTISYAGLRNPEAVVAGNYVRVRLNTTANDGVWTATRLVGRDESKRVLRTREKAELEGVITEYSGSGTSFVVNGTPVDASAARFEDGTAANIAVGVRVEIEGASREGVLIARKVEFEADGDDDDHGGSAFELQGRPSAVTAETSDRGTFVLRRLTITYGPATVFEGGTAAELSTSSRIEVRASLSPDRTSLIAEEIEFEDEDDSESGDEGNGEGGTGGPTP